MRINRRRKYRLVCIITVMSILMLTVQGSEQIVLKGGMGDTNEIFELLGIDNVIEITRFNENAKLYQVEKGCKLTMLDERVWYLHIDAVDIQGESVKSKEVSTRFWQEALEDEVMFTAWDASEEGYLTEGNTYGTLQEAKLESDIVYYTKGTSITFNTPGSYVVNYSVGPWAREPFVLEVVDINEIEEVADQIEEGEVEQDDESQPLEIRERVIGIAEPAPLRLLVNDQQLLVESYVIADQYYIKLRDFAMITTGSSYQFNLIWETQNNTIDIVSGIPYSEKEFYHLHGDGKDKYYYTSTAAIYRDGEFLDVEVYKIKNNNYFNMQDLIALFGINGYWESEYLVLEF